MSKNNAQRDSFSRVLQSLFILKSRLLRFLYHLRCCAAILEVAQEQEDLQSEKTGATVGDVRLEVFSRQASEEEVRTKPLPQILGVAAEVREAVKLPEAPDSPITHPAATNAKAVPAETLMGSNEENEQCLVDDEAGQSSTVGAEAGLGTKSRRTKASKVQKKGKGEASRRTRSKPSTATDAD